ncbi:MAG: hypothetical protein R2685_11055 [Candidatus Nitrosocosmicus sp.]|nr:hypothetical protein [Candidatus Nitrosocosmicus sp.]
MNLKRLLCEFIYDTHDLVKDAEIKTDRIDIDYFYCKRCNKRLKIVNKYVPLSGSYKVHIPRWLDPN